MMNNLLASREFFLAILIGIILILLGIYSEHFFTMLNIRGLLFNISVYGIVSAGMTILFVSKGIDLSIGTVMAFIGVVLGETLARGVPVLLVIIFTILLGAIIGASIGVLVTKIGINPFIVTLAYFFCFKGLAFLFGLISEKSKGQIPFFGDFPDSFNNIAGSQFYGIEYIFFYALFIVILYHFLLTKNKFFRQNYFLGGNENAARMVGINVDFLKIFNYSLVTATGAIAIMLRASRVQGTNATFGYPTFALIIVTAVILGGASLKGGVGSVIGSFLGVILISIIYNAMIMMGFNPFYTEFSVGIILFIAVLLDEFKLLTNFTK